MTGKSAMNQKFSLVATAAALLMGLCAASAAEPMDSLRLPPRAIPAMATSEFWVKHLTDPDRVLLSPAAIQTANETTQQTQGTGVVNLRSLPEEFDGIVHAVELARFAEKPGLYADGEPIDLAWYSTIRENILLAPATHTQRVQYALVTTHTDLKLLPSSQRLTDTPEMRDWDELMNSSLTVNEPVLVYIRTRDDAFAWVRSATAEGWVRTTDIAVCADRDAWLAAQEPKRFVVVTGSRVYLEPEADAPDLSEKCLRMGTVLELADSPAPDAARVPWYAWYVRMPVRMADGTCAFRTVALPANRDIHVGWLPLTRANIIRQALKHLGERYGWGGMLRSQDCSGMIGEIYRCFGLRLPRDTRPLTRSPFRTEDIRALDTAGRREVLTKTAPGSLLFMPGHILLWLGRAEGGDYAIHDMNRCIDGRIGAVSINDISTLRRANGMVFLDVLECIVHIPDEPLPAPAAGK